MSSITPSETMRGRVKESRYKIWILTRLNRWIFTIGISVLVFLSLLLLSQLGPVRLRTTIGTADALWWIFSPLITAIITAVALVVTFNQLVLSQELGALGDQRERMEAAMDFRTEVESWIDKSVAPPEPSAFLAALIEALQKRANDLNETGVNLDNTSLESFAQDLQTDADRVRSALLDAQFGTFDVVFAALNFNYSWKIYEGRRLLAESNDNRSEFPAQTLDEIITLLEFYGPAREHFKTLYFQWELVNLSRVMLFVSVPALLTAFGMLMFVDATVLQTEFLGIDRLTWLMCLAITVALLPFFVLFSYVLRIATVTQRTLAMGPFVLRQSERSVEL